MSPYRMQGLALIVIVLLSGGSGLCRAAERSLLNVSYDPSREFYQELNAAFVADWKAKTGETIRVNQSHGGSGKQARAVLDGLEADVVTLALAYDIDALAERGLLTPDWQSHLPHDSTPYTSTIVLLVRKGNPKNIHDWNDLDRPDVLTVMANPRTSGAARWGYLAAWAWAEHHFGRDQDKIRAYMRAWVSRIPVFDTGARAATTTFTRRGVGDVLVIWENEALLALDDLSLQTSGQGFEIIRPSLSILAAPPVAVVDRFVDKHQTRDLAEAYLCFLLSNTGQHLAVKHHYRPFDNNLSPLPAMNVVRVNDIFGGWAAAHRDHFADGASFDQLTEH